MLLAVCTLSLSLGLAPRRASPHDHKQMSEVVSGGNGVHKEWEGDSGDIPFGLTRGETADNPTPVNMCLHVSARVCVCACVRVCRQRHIHQPITRVPPLQMGAGGSGVKYTRV